MKRSLIIHAASVAGENSEAAGNGALIIRIELGTQDQGIFGRPTAASVVAAVLVPADTVTGAAVGWWW